MAKFEVMIIETLSTEVIIEADSAEEAYNKAGEKWAKGEYELDAADFDCVDFDVKPIGYKDLEMCE